MYEGINTAKTTNFLLSTQTLFLAKTGNKSDSAKRVVDRCLGSELFSREYQFCFANPRIFGLRKYFPVQ